MVSITRRDDGDFIVDGKWFERERFLKMMKRIKRNGFEGKTVSHLDGDISFINHSFLESSVVVIRSADDNEYLKVGIPEKPPSSVRTMDEALEKSDSFHIFAEASHEEWVAAFEEIKDELTEKEKYLYW